MLMEKILAFEIKPSMNVETINWQFNNVEIETTGENCF